MKCKKIKELVHGEEVCTSLKDEMDEKNMVEVVIYKGTYGLRIEFPDDKDQRGILLDYFNGELSVKIWTEDGNDDFTHNISLKGII